MRFTKRTPGKALTSGMVAVLVLVLLAGVAAAQGTVTELGQGSSDDLVAPPSPSCDADALELIPEVSFTSLAQPIGVPRLGVGNGLVTEYDIPDFPELEPGVIDVVEIITFDAFTGRSGWPPQDNESVAIEFLLDGEVQATTDFTPDLEDEVSAAWAQTDLGEHDLDNGADAARIIHFNESSNSDSVVVSSLCAVFTADDAPVDEDTAGDDDADTDDTDTDDTDDEDAATAGDDDDDPESLTLAELIEQNANNDDDGAADEGVDGDELALTGANEIAFVIIALGVILFGIAMKVQGQDPEELTY